VSWASRFLFIEILASYTVESRYSIIRPLFIVQLNLVRKPHILILTLNSVYQGSVGKTEGDEIRNE